MIEGRQIIKARGGIPPLDGESLESICIPYRYDLIKGFYEEDKN